MNSGAAFSYLTENNIARTIVAASIAGLVLFFDLMMPLGVAGGVPYVALVMMGLWFPKREHVFHLAVIATALTLLGYAFSPEGGLSWVVFSNRMLAIFAIWVTAVLIYNRMKLVADQNKLAHAVEQCSVGIVITDVDGIIEYVNPKTLAMSGYEESEVIGQTSSIFKSGKVPLATYQNLWNTIQSGERWQGEIVNKAKDGKFYWENVSISPMLDNIGEISGFIAIKEDITDRKRTETELFTATQQAEAANEAKSIFMTSMSHELRTPLNAILGFSETMKLQILGPLGSERYLVYAGDIHDSAEHLRQLIDDILDLSKVESGKQNIRDQEISVPDLVHTCLSLIGVMAAKSEITIDEDIEDGMPPLRADDRIVRQIILNLLSNAVKFTPKYGRVLFRAFIVEDASMVMEIIDNGIGISKEDHEKVFSAFGQVGDDLTHTPKGTGLGLPLSRRLMELHGGQLHLDSQLGTGTTVRLRFPPERLIRKPVAEKLHIFSQAANSN